MAQIQQLVLEKELDGRLGWLILLRWFAAAGVFLMISVVHFSLHTPLMLLPLYLGGLFLIAYNALFYKYNQILKTRREQSRWFHEASRFANVQISLDLLLLGYFVYFSGGIENPFIFYFIFHIVIASISLSNKAAYAQAGFAVTLMSLITILERLDVIPHFHIDGFLPSSMCLQGWMYPAGELFVFATTLFLVVYMTTSIVNRVREGERELLVANQKLAQQDRIKSQYVLKVSHDIQSHLTTIQSCVEVVLNGYTGDISEKSSDMLQKAFARSGKLIQFVKDLLDLSRMRAMEEIEKEKLSLTETIERAVDQLKMQAEKKQQSVTVDLQDAVFVMGNAHAVDELMVNLIGNGIRYTPEGGKIDVKMEWADEKHIRVSVRDTGIGIPAESIPRIFEDFYRADNAVKATHNGTGLGLSIVKQIVESHGGNIGVSSEVGQGSTFVFELPVAGSV